MKMNNEFELCTPVVYVIFNRPDCVRQSFASIRKARPKKLFIIADGPRGDHPDDDKRCKECRAIVEDIDWECEVYRNYSDVNLGCGRRPASGFSWVFSQEQEAIIIEDDCVPSMSFYRFCQEMLEKYRNDERVLSISGLGFGYKPENGGDYYFSRFNNTLGWATWKRVWDMYDYEMKNYPQFKQSNLLQDLLLRKDYIDYWYRVFDDIYEGRMTSAWDGQFMFLSFMHNGLHLYPKKNMVQYIGWGDDSSHCPVYPSEGSPMALISNLPPEEMSFPVNILRDVYDDFLTDCKIMEDIFYVPINSKKKLVALDKSEIELMKNAENLIIYGAGKVCQELISQLANNGVHHFFVAVTKNAENAYVMGNKVVEISSLISMKENSLVVIAVKSKDAIENMIYELKNLGFVNYLILKEK